MRTLLSYPEVIKHQSNSTLAPFNHTRYIAQLSYKRQPQGFKVALNSKTDEITAAIMSPDLTTFRILITSATNTFYMLQ